MEKGQRGDFLTTKNTKKETAGDFNHRWRLIREVLSV